MTLESFKLQLQKRYDLVCTPHPFSYGVTDKNVDALLSDYFSMSLMFPYVQSAAHEKIAEDYLLANEEVPYACEATAVIGAFLAWDEFGGYFKIKSCGPQALPQILETKGFHANLLKEDIFNLTGKKLAYGYSAATRRYMQNLKKGLSSKNHIERVAYMVAFEMNAATMIQNLYDSLKRVFPLTGQSLTYFEAHIGGNDPAEVYHVDMTTRLIETVVCKTEFVAFLSFFETACELNGNWCEQIKHRTELALKGSDCAEAHSL